MWFVGALVTRGRPFLSPKVVDVPIIGEGRLSPVPEISREAPAVRHKRGTTGAGSPRGGQRGGNGGQRSGWRSALSGAFTVLRGRYW